MEATHILFARDLAKYLKVHDLGAYYAGAVYPDTRYVTKLERHLTHASPAPQNPFIEELSDFEKGWGTHILYDKVAGDLLRELVKDNPEEFWIAITAAKIVEDMQSVELLNEDIRILDDLHYSISVRNEPLEELNVFLRHLKDLYRERPSLVDYADYSKKIGIPNEIADRVSQVVESFMKDENSRQEILAIYSRALRVVTKNR